MARSKTVLPVSGGPTTFLWILAIVAALYFAHEIVLPFALAVLLSFLLGPLVKRLEQWKVPRGPAVLMVVGVAVMGVGMLSYVVGEQLYEVADRLPTYEGNITAKVKLLRGNGDGVFTKVATAFDHLRAACSPAPACSARCRAPVLPEMPGGGEPGCRPRWLLHERCRSRLSSRSPCWESSGGCWAR